MCARYQLPSDWQNFPMMKPSDFEPNLDVRPTHRMPIGRLFDGNLETEWRHGGFLRSWPGKSGKMTRHQLINAVGEELQVKKSFRNAYETSRCIIPMAAWYEWPTLGGVKTRVEIGLKRRTIFAVAGLFETSEDPATGEPVDTYTMVTVPPNEILGQVHDRSPLVLRLEDHAAWLEGGASAQALIGAYPECDAFYLKPVDVPPQHTLF